MKSEPLGGTSRGVRIACETGPGRSPGTGLDSGGLRAPEHLKVAPFENIASFAPYPHPTMKPPRLLKSSLLVLALLTALPVVAGTGQPAPFREMRAPTPEELAAGAPLAVVIRQVTAIQKDFETSKGRVVAPPAKKPAPAKPTPGKKSKKQEEKEEVKTKEEEQKAAAGAASDKAGIDAIFATMTPALQNSLNRPTPLRKTDHYDNLTKVDPAKPILFNVTAGDEKHFVANVTFVSKVYGRHTRTFYLKKFDGGWLQCVPDELPGDMMAKLGIPRKK